MLSRQLGAFRLIFRKLGSTKKLFDSHGPGVKKITSVLCFNYTDIHAHLHSVTPTPNSHTYPHLHSVTPTHVHTQSTHPCQQTPTLSHTHPCQQTPTLSYNLPYPHSVTPTHTYTDPPTHTPTPTHTHTQHTQLHTQGQSMTDHPVKGTTPSQICMNSSTHVHHDWESNQMHYRLISII